LLSLNQLIYTLHYVPDKTRSVLSVADRHRACAIPNRQVIPDDGGHIEERSALRSLARDVGMSTRQLERLFVGILAAAPKRYYMELRLQKSRKPADANRT